MGAFQIAELDQTSKKLFNTPPSSRRSMKVPMDVSSGSSTRERSTNISDNGVNKLTPYKSPGFYIRPAKGLVVPLVSICCLMLFSNINKYCCFKLLLIQSVKTKFKVTEEMVLGKTATQVATYVFHEDKDPEYDSLDPLLFA